MHQSLFIVIEDVRLGRFGLANSFIESECDTFLSCLFLFLLHCLQFFLNQLRSWKCKEGPNEVLSIEVLLSSIIRLKSRMCYKNVALFHFEVIHLFVLEDSNALHVDVVC